MAAKRSPILGYNHNVRFRGIVLHIQTEDSGVGNPHVFSHLFHGGVILSTRKLVYDAGSNEESVKSLMQAQHKAVLKDLRRGTFDDKIDSYLAGTPGLLPRESVADSARASDPELAAAPVAVEPVAVEPVAVEPVAVEPIAAESSEPIVEVIEAALSEPVAVEPITAAPLDFDATQQVPTIPFELGIDGPGPAFLLDDNDIFDAMPRPELARAPTERVGTVPMAEYPSPPPTVAPARTDVSAAMRAIQIADEDLAGALADDGPAEIHSPAPPSAPTPPGVIPERVGEYHLARKSTVVENPPAPARPPIPRPTPVGSRVPTPSSARPVTEPGTRPSSPRPTPPAIPARPSTFRSPPPPPPALRPRSPVAGHAPPPLIRPTPQAPIPRGLPTRPPTADASGPVVARPAIQPPRRPAAGGVVVSRPAVIVGGRGASATTPPPKVRRAKDSESFGGDLISERSLDEVILAYLSEDNSED